MLSRSCLYLFNSQIAFCKSRWRFCHWQFASCLRISFLSFLFLCQRWTGNFCRRYTTFNRASVWRSMKSMCFVIWQKFIRILLKTRWQLTCWAIPHTVRLPFNSPGTFLYILVSQYFQFWLWVLHKFFYNLVFPFFWLAYFSLFILASSLYLQC